MKNQVETNKSSKRKVTSEEKFFMILRLDRSRRRWRFLSIIFALCAVFALIYFLTGKSDKAVLPTSEYIAEIKIEGIITDNEYRAKKLEKIKNDDNVKAVILTIDSPGGAMVPGLELLDALKEIGAVKPLVVQMKSVAASAGYLISLSGEYVVANKATLTGSIGVLMPLVDARELANKIGIKSAEVTSGDLKDITSPLAERSQKAKNHLQNTVQTLQKMFMQEVKTRRNISSKVELLMSDGRFIIGQHALKYNLIDAIGGKKELLEFLEKNNHISKGLEIFEVSLEEDEDVKLRDLLTNKLSSSIALQLKNMLLTYGLTPQAY